jgi:hypothetical protein
METPTFPALVSPKGRLQFGEVERRGLDMWLSTLAGKAVTVKVHEDRASLSERQRRWYFGQILKRITDHTGQERDDLHLYFKDKFLGAPENRLIVLVDGNGEIVDERQVPIDPSITVLTTKQMANYCDQIRMFAAVPPLCIDIPNPSKDFRTAR